MPDDSRLPSTHVTLRLPADLVEQFDRLATAMDRPRSWVMLRALRQYLEAEGAEIAEDIESLAQLDRGEYEPFDTVFAEAERIIKQAEKKKRQRK
jgi:predicted transcriptional regulator